MAQIDNRFQPGSVQVFLTADFGIFFEHKLQPFSH